MASILEFRPEGIYCPQGDFFIDPWKPVDAAVITHAHSDHARYGMKSYLAHHDSVPVMRHRLGTDIHVQGIDYGEILNRNGVKISLHPAGHIPGSAQVRVEYKGEVWVVSGDYKLGHDPNCRSFEPVKCHTFITESTFGLPVFQWEESNRVFGEMEDWWRQNASTGKASVLCCYSLGKAQRILSGLNEEHGPLFVHGAIENMNEVLRDAGHHIRSTPGLLDVGKDELRNALILAPPSVLGSSWIKRVGDHSTAMASGWMAMRGTRRRRNVDKGFVLSDHADWAELNLAVKETGAENVFVTHGYSTTFARWLTEQGLNAQPIRTEFSGDLSEADEPTASKEGKA